MDPFAHLSACNGTLAHLSACNGSLACLSACNGSLCTPVCKARHSLPQKQARLRVFVVSNQLKPVRHDIDGVHNAVAGRDNLLAT